MGWDRSLRRMCIVLSFCHKALSIYSCLAFLKYRKILSYIGHSTTEEAKWIFKYSIPDLFLSYLPKYCNFSPEILSLWRTNNVYLSPYGLHRYFLLPHLTSRPSAPNRTLLIGKTKVIGIITSAQESIASPLAVSARYAGLGLVTTNVNILAHNSRVIDYNIAI